jgi:hypothetical protein
MTIKNGEYHWEWQQGDGPHVWLRDTSGTLLNQTGSRTLGLIDPCDEGWQVRLWKVRSFSEQVAVLPKTMATKGVKAAAKMILLSLKQGD